MLVMLESRYHLSTNTTVEKLCDGKLNLTLLLRLNKYYVACIETNISVLLLHTNFLKGMRNIPLSRMWVSI